LPAGSARDRRLAVGLIRRTLAQEWDTLPR
jgi:hypothetical protein